MDCGKQGYSINAWMTEYFIVHLYCSHNSPFTKSLFLKSNSLTVKQPYIYICLCCSASVSLCCVLNLSLVLFCLYQSTLCCVLNLSLVLFCLSQSMLYLNLSLVFDVSDKDGRCIVWETLHTWNRDVQVHYIHLSKCQLFVVEKSVWHLVEWIGRSA